MTATDTQSHPVEVLKNAIRHAAYESRLRPDYWLTNTWIAAQRSQPEEAAKDVDARYPDRLGSFGLQVALSALEAQHSQGQALDHKLGIGAALAAALLPVGPLAALAAGRESVGVFPAAVGFMAAVLLLFGLASSLRGMWVRTFAGVPQFEVVLEQAQDEEFDDDAVLWASAASLDAAVRDNDELIHQKAAAVRVTWSAVLAAALLLSLFVLFLVGSPPGSDGGEGEAARRPSLPVAVVEVVVWEKIPIPLSSSLTA